MVEMAASVEPKRKEGPEPTPAPPAHLRDESLLKFVGTATIILGVVLLVSSSIAIAALSILRYTLVEWIPILPLSLLLIFVGGLVNVYFRKVIDHALNPKKAQEAPRAPYSYAYPYQMPPPYYAMRMPSPTYAPAPAVAAPAPSVQRPAASMRFCIQCGKQIPVEAKFCPYCRHAYTN